MGGETGALWSVPAGWLGPHQRAAPPRPEPVVFLPCLKGVVSQQGVASEVCVDAAGSTSDEREAVIHPPSKRRKEDATLRGVADTFSADPEQVQACFVFLTNAGFVATLCRAGPSASLFP